MCDSGYFSVTGTVWHVVTVSGNGKLWIFQILSDHGANNRVGLVWDAEPGAKFFIDGKQLNIFLKNAILPEKVV